MIIKRQLFFLIAVVSVTSNALAGSGTASALKRLNTPTMSNDSIQVKLFNKLAKASIEEGASRFVTKGNNSYSIGDSQGTWSLSCTQGAAGVSCNLAETAKSSFGVETAFSPFGDESGKGTLISVLGGGNQVGGNLIASIEDQALRLGCIINLGAQTRSVRCLVEEKK